MTTLKEGYEIPFLEPPPLSLGLDPLFHSTLVLNEQKRLALDQAVEDMVQKGAIEIAPLPLGFYSRLFLVPKPEGYGDR